MDRFGRFPRRLLESKLIWVAWLVILASSRVSPGSGGTPASRPLDPYNACGLNSLYIVARWNGVATSLTALRTELAPGPEGDCSIADLERASKRLGMTPISARVAPEDLPKVPLPAIVHLTSRSPHSLANHYVVLAGLVPNGVVTIDAPEPATIHPYAEFMSEWSGAIVAFAPGPDEEARFRSLLDRQAWPQWATATLAGVSAGVFTLAWIGRRERRLRDLHHVIESEGKSMRRIFRIFGFVGLAAIAGCGEADQQSPVVGVERSPGGVTNPKFPPSQIDLGGDVVDLGVLDSGESDFSVPIKNRGTNPLLIKEIKSTCSCTKAEATREIAPNGSGVLKGKVNVQSGPGGALLTLTAGPEEAREVRIKWFGKSSPTLLPSSFDVPLKVGVKEVREIDVTYPSGDPPTPLEFVGVHGLPEGCHAELIANNPSAIKPVPGLSTTLHAAASPFVGEARIRIELMMTTPGSFSAECLFRFQQQSRPIDLPFRLITRVDEGLRCRPETLLFGASSQESLQRLRRKVTLMSDAAGDRFEIIEKPDYLNVQVEETMSAPMTQAILTAEVAFPPPPGESRRRLVIRDAAGRRVEVSLLMSVPN